VIGLTSAANLAFVEELGVYDQVLTYDDLDRLEAKPAVYVDITGNRDVLQAVHRRLAGDLAHSMVVGGTHWDHQPEVVVDELRGPEPTFFFAPAQIAKRSKEWGRHELESRLGETWERYATWTEQWLDFRHASGAEAVTAVYHELLGGHPDPRAGFICSLTTDQ